MTQIALNDELMITRHRFWSL